MRRSSLIAGLLLIAPWACHGPAPEAPPAAADHAAGRARIRPVRVGTVAPERPDLPLSPLTYGTGFLAKTLAYETLTSVDEQGRPAPGLAEHIEPLGDGSSWRFRLRPGARFHDGRPLDAEAVVEHVRRWLAGAEHGWVGAAARLRDVVAEDSSTVRFDLDAPYALPFDLMLINPCSIAGPGDHAPAGTGPWRLAEVDLERHVLCRRRDDSADGPRELDIRFVAADGESVRGLTAALVADEVDLVFDDWLPRLPRGELWDVSVRSGFVLEQAPGSTVTLLVFNPSRPPFHSEAARRRVAAEVDRLDLVAEAELGFADPVSTLFAPAVADWPRRTAGGDAPAAGGAAPSDLAVEFLIHQESPSELRAAARLASQLRRAGVAVDLLPADPAEYAERLRSGRFDLRLARTWGVPYDPQATLLARLVQPTSPDTAVDDPPWFVHADLTAAIGELVATFEPEARIATYRRVQDLIDRHVAVVPLYAARRVALVHPDVSGFRFTHNPYELEADELRRRR